jgi:hypothetical protein
VLNENIAINSIKGRRGRDRMVVGLKTTCAISAYHYENSNISHCEVYSIQHYVIKFVSDLRQALLRFTPPK